MVLRTGLSRRSAHSDRLGCGDNQDHSVTVMILAATGMEGYHLAIKVIDL